MHKVKTFSYFLQNCHQWLCASISTFELKIVVCFCSTFVTISLRKSPAENVNFLCHSSVLVLPPRQQQESWVFFFMKNYSNFIHHVGLLTSKTNASLRSARRCEREQTFFKVEIEISISSLALSLSPVATLLFYSDFCAIKSFEFQTSREAYECRPNDSSLRRIRGRKLEIFPSKKFEFLNRKSTEQHFWNSMIFVLF